MDVEKSRASVSAGETRAREAEGHAESAGPQLGVGLAASANLVPVLPRQQQVFPSHELSSLPVSFFVPRHNDWAINFLSSCPYMVKLGPQIVFCVCRQRVLTY